MCRLYSSICRIVYPTISCMTAEPQHSRSSRCGRKRVVIDGWHWVLALLLPIALCQFSVFNSLSPPFPYSLFFLTSCPRIIADIWVHNLCQFGASPAWYIACFSVYNAFAIASVNRLAYSPFPCTPVLTPLPLFCYSCACIFATWLAKSQRNNKSTSTLIIYLYIISMVVVVVIVQPSRQSSQRLFWTMLAYFIKYNSIRSAAQKNQEGNLWEGRRESTLMGLGYFGKH